MIVEGDPEAGRIYKEGDFQPDHKNPEREKRVQHWMDEINPKKTIVFCATQEHAGLVRDYINRVCERTGLDNQQ